MAYTQYTLATLAADISASLQDPSNVYWSLDEIYRSIKEALLYWGLLTAHWRERGQFATVTGTAFYDLTAQLPALRTQYYTLGDLTREVQYHLLEPAGGTGGVGMTSQFAVARLTAALKRKRNEFVLDASVPFVEASFNVASAASGRTQLDQSVVLIQRASWRDTKSVYTVLRREDALTADSADYLWNLKPGVPFAYSTAETRPIEIQFVPPPAAAGRLHLIYVQSLDLAIADGTLLAVPDEMNCGIKYGALYDILSTHNEGFDPLRAKYCLERYNQAVEAARHHKTVARLQVNERTMPIDTLWNLDSQRPRWQNQSGRPNLCGVACDILALSKVPDGVYSITSDLVRAAPLPTLTTDYIQIGREEMTYIFDYCRHVLSFKLGGEEFVATMPLYVNFVSGAMQRNKILAAKAKYLTALFGQPEKEELIEQPA